VIFSGISSQQVNQNKNFKLGGYHQSLGTICVTIRRSRANNWILRQLKATINPVENPDPISPAYN
jgi:hypothetical protein